MGSSQSVRVRALLLNLVAHLCLQITLLLQTIRKSLFSKCSDLLVRLWTLFDELPKYDNLFMRNNHDC